MTEILPPSAIRVHIHDAVSSALSVLAESRIRSDNEDQSNSDRCVVCTLPAGECGHTQEWLLARTDRVLYALDEAEEEIRDALSVVEDTRTLTRIGVQYSAEFSPLDFRWKVCEATLSDRIGGTYVDLSSPGPRVAHTMVACGQFMVVFGGLEEEKGRNKVSARLHVFDTQTYSWHLPHVTGKRPEPRHGHTAVALNDDQMLLFGGKGRTGLFLNDTWIFSLQTATWYHVEDGTDGNGGAPWPAPRYHAAAALLDGTVYLSGGTDGDQLFGDLFTFNIRTRRWNYHVGVGDVPSGRFGHRLVTVRKTLYLLGGSTVVPSSENQDALDILELASHVQHAQRVLHSYVDEREHIDLMARLVEVKALDSNAIREMHATGSVATTSIVQQASRVSEDELKFLRSVQGANFASGDQLRGGASRLESHALDVYKMDTSTYVWTKLRQLRGVNPRTQRDFTVLGFPNEIYVAGGCTPSSEKPVLTEDDFVVYKLDLNELMWSVVEVDGTSTAMQPSIEAARADLRRARARVQAARAQGFAVGAPGGVTRDLLQAEALEKVCSWRVSVLKKEASRFRSAPAARAGACVARIGARAFYYGGWSVQGATEDFFVLDMEHEQAKQDRLQAEFHTRLERERTTAEAAAQTAAALTAFELREQWQAERDREAQEILQMQKEEELSRLPPLSQAPAPLLLLATHNALHVHWPAMLQNVNRKKLQPGDVTYVLQMQGGFLSLHPEEEVEVHYVLQPGVDSRGVWYPATVKATNLDGTLAVRTQDGRIERRVDPKRIRLPFEARRAWSTLYIGKGNVNVLGRDRMPCLRSSYLVRDESTDTDYAITGLVPDRILQYNPNLTVNVALRLQLVGADEPEGTWSIPSTIVSFSTQPSYIFGQSDQDLALDNPWTSAASEISLSVLTMSETIVTSATTATSKTRKRLLGAVAAGQQTQICTQGEETTASGCGDEYM